MTSGSLKPVSAAALLLGATLLAAGHARADQVIPDDLIVQGSICAGFDCVNNESFGFDTIILKENNLRIFFNDTSTGVGFPANKWRIVANDSASGGANFLGIEDATAGRMLFQVSAGAPVASLFVDSSGRVGLKTATPLTELHLNDGDTPTIRMEQNNASGFTAQTWDVGANEANFFVRDLTRGSKLSFRIRPGAPTSSLDIAANGNVGIGVASADSKLHVAGDAHFERAGGSAFFIQTPGPDVRMFSNAPIVLQPNSGNVGIGTLAPAARFHTTGTVRFGGVAGCGAGIMSDGVGTLSCIGSSRRIKNISGDLAPDVALANVMALRPQTGSYKSTPEVPEHWLIAEDVAAIDPALAGLLEGQPNVVKTQNVMADLVAVVQQQQRDIAQQQSEIAELKRLLQAK